MSAISQGGRLNVALSLSPNIANNAIRISRELKSQGGLFVLDQKTHKPHLTFYMSDFPVKNIPAINNFLKKTAKKFRPILLEPRSFRQKKDGFVDITFKMNSGIQEFQRELVFKLNPFREGLPAHAERKGEFNKSEQKNIQRFGYPEIAPRFYPHLTFTRLKPDARSKKINFSWKKELFAGRVNKFSLFEVGQFGTCRKVIGTYVLKS